MWNLCVVRAQCQRRINIIGKERRCATVNWLHFDKRFLIDDGTDGFYDVVVFLLSPFCGWGWGGGGVGWIRRQSDRSTKIDTGDGRLVMDGRRGNIYIYIAYNIRICFISIWVDHIIRFINVRYLLGAMARLFSFKHNVFQSEFVLLKW